MNIHIFIICYNEQVLLPETIKHYKKYLPNSIITIFDNESTDNSVELAKTLGCKVVSWATNNIIDDIILVSVKNNCWKEVKDGWVIVVDMDEWLCVTEDDLYKEFEAGTSILNIKGYDMIGESKRLDLTDIDLQTIQKAVYNHNEDKKLCFLREKIGEMNYAPGAHLSLPFGEIKHSSQTYINKHMNYLGLPYFLNKMINRHSRSHLMRKLGFACHYTNDMDKIVDEYNLKLLNAHEKFD